MPLLVVGYCVSAYGTYLNLLAAGLFSYQVTGSAWGVGVFMALRLTAGFLTGLVAGRLVNAVDRRRLMIGANLAQAAAMVALGLLPGPVVLGVAMVVLGAGNTVFTVALRSAIPDLVGGPQAPRANGLLVTGRSLAMVAGFGSASIVVALGGFTAVFLINAGSFVVCAVALALLKPQVGAGDTGDTAGATPAAEGVLTPRLRALILLRGADALGSAAHNVALPVFATLTAPDDPAAAMTLFMTSWAVGVVFAHQVVSRWAGAFGDRAVAVGTCVMSLSFVAAFTGLPAPLLICVMALAGLADGVTEIACVSRLQEASSHLRGRLMALSTTAETAGFGGGTLVASALLTALPVIGVVAVMHAVPVLAACGLLLLGKEEVHVASVVPGTGAGVG